MFKSIKWKFITVYFLLVFISMAIVTTFIVKNLETYQINQITSTMENSIKKLVNSSTYLEQSDNLNDFQSDIQKVVREWPISSSERMYIIDAIDGYEIIADTTSIEINKKSAFDIKQIREDLVILSQKNMEIEKSISSNYDDNGKSMHMSVPILNDIGEVKGIVYMLKDLSGMYSTVEESRDLLLKATVMALVITVVLGYFIAKSITEPINDLTVKTERMASGDFDQLVEVRSNDEIGELASMFNYLRLELKGSISKLTREKNRLDIMFANMADGVMLVDRTGKIVHANQVMSNIMDISYDELLNYNYNEMIKDLDSEYTLECIKEKDLEHGNSNIEINLSVYNMRYGLIKDESGEVDGMIIVFQDITEQQKLDNMRKEFVADVSHELKTPITNIKSYAETLLNAEVEADMRKTFLTVIDDECDRMARIVRELLQLSNFDAKIVNWKKEHIRLNEFIEKVYFKIKISADEKNQTITINKCSDRAEVFADSDGLEQVLLNILTNAIKYTEDGGKIEISTVKKDRNIIVSVSDNGIGIPESDLKRIFERFYRVDKARARELGGTGLGLPIAKHIVESHGGQIFIKSEYKKGTTIDIILPIEVDIEKVM